jgi:hypothetical protein
MSCSFSGLLKQVSLLIALGETEGDAADFSEELAGSGAVFEYPPEDFAAVLAFVAGFLPVVALPEAKSFERFEYASDDVGFVKIAVDDVVCAAMAFLEAGFNEVTQNA